MCIRDRPYINGTYILLELNTIRFLRVKKCVLIIRNLYIGYFMFTFKFSFYYQSVLERNLVTKFGVRVICVVRKVN